MSVKILYINSGFWIKYASYIWNKVVSLFEPPSTPI